MATLAMPAPTDSSNADSDADVFCPECTYELQPWEVHLLKHLGCPFCGSALELGTTLTLRAR